MLIAMKAKQAFSYGGKNLAIDDPFEATHGHAILLSLLGRACTADGKMLTAASKKKAPVKRAPRKQGTYRRRDMRAGENK